MIGFVVHTVVSAILLFLVGRMVSGIDVRDGKVALFGALGLTLANAVLGPLLLKLTLPIPFFSLGLVWVVNAFVLVLLADFVDGLEVDGFGTALWGSALLGLMSMLAGGLF